MNKNEIDLRPYGYAEGDYWHKHCRECQREFIADKKAFNCEECARLLFSNKTEKRKTKIIIKYCPVCKNLTFWDKPDYKPETDDTYVQCQNCWSIINVNKAVELKKYKVKEDKTIQEIIKGMSNLVNACKDDPEKAREFLQKTGIYTKDDKLTENYK